MRTPAGGRPKAAELWKHATILPADEKYQGARVRCKYFGLEFASSATRISSHINQIKGKGVRPCPNPPKEKDHLLDSEALLIVDRSRDYNKLIERMADCNVSSKTMWEGIKALPQVQISRKDTHQERIKVGPFYVSNTVNERDRQLIGYIFKPSRELFFIPFSSSRSFLYKYDQMDTLKPQTHLHSSIIYIFVGILTEIERGKKSKPLNWYLPVRFSSAALNNGDVRSFRDYFRGHDMKPNYMSDLVDCEKLRAMA